MPKFKVKCYYEYMGCVEVEADTPQEAHEKGYIICHNMTTDDLHFLGYVSSEVEDEEGEITTF
jgi:hypothetical protein